MIVGLFDVAGGGGQPGRRFHSIAQPEAGRDRCRHRARLYRGRLHTRQTSRYFGPATNPQAPFIVFVFCNAVGVSRDMLVSEPYKR